MKKTILVLMMFLVLTPITILASEMDTLDSKAIAFELKQMNNKTSELCGNAILEYRAEATREIGVAKEEIKSEVNSFLRKQRLLFIAGALLASFLGTSAALMMRDIMVQKKDTANYKKIMESIKSLKTKKKQIIKKRKKEAKK